MAAFARMLFYVVFAAIGAGLGAAVVAFLLDGWAVQGQRLGRLVKRLGPLLLATAGALLGSWGGARLGGTPWGVLLGAVVGAFVGFRIGRALGGGSLDREARLAYLRALVSAAAAEGRIGPERTRILVRAATRLFGEKEVAESDIEALMRTAQQQPNSPREAAQFARRLPPELQGVLAYDVLSLLYAGGRLSQGERLWLDDYIEAGAIPDRSILKFFDRRFDRHSEQRPQWLEELELPPDADAEQIKRAYREKARQYHPDKHANLPEHIRELTESKMAAITDAYQKLMEAQDGASGTLQFRHAERPESFEKPSKGPFECACWLCGSEHRIEEDEDPAAERCTDCHALLGVASEPG